MNKYEELAKELHQQIRDGQFKVNMKLPSVRQLCDRHKLSMSTVVRALEVLEQDGVIEGRERSGFYISAANIQSSVPIPEASYILEQPTKINNQELILGLMKSIYNPKLLNLGAAIPAQSFLPVKDIDKASRIAMRSTQHQRDKYMPMPGDRVLREQISVYMRNLNCEVDPEHIMVTSGCQEATMLVLLSCFEKGSTIAVETPTYPGFLQTCELLNLEVIEIPTDPRTGVSIGALELAIQQWSIAGLLLSSNYSNPTCARMPTDKKKTLLDLCDRHSIRIVEDDVYGDISHDPYYRPRPIKSFDKNDTVIYCSSFSKTVSPGLRVGWVVNPTLQKNIEYSKYVAGLSCVTTSQYIMAEYLKLGKHERYLQSARRRYGMQSNLMLERMYELLPEGTRITQPRGGFTLWLSLPSHIDTLELLEKTMAKGVCFNPGVLFSALNKHRNCLRLSCAMEWNENLESALGVLAKESHKLM